MAEPAARFCPDCGEDISARHLNARRCDPCARERRKARELRSNRERYRRPEVRAKRAEYNRAYRERPGAREVIREWNRKWRNSPRGRAVRAAYNRRPEVKAANARRMRERHSPRPRRLEVAPTSAAHGPSTLAPEVAGRVTKPRSTYRRDERLAYARAMAAAAGPRPRECSDCGAGVSPATLERNGGLCGFCVEIERRRAA